MDDDRTKLLHSLTIDRAKTDASRPQRRLWPLVLLGLLAAGAASVGGVGKAIDAMFANSPYETATDTEKAFNKAFIAQLGNIALIVTARSPPAPARSPCCAPSASGAFPPSSARWSNH